MTLTRTEKTKAAETLYLYRWKRYLGMPSLEGNRSGQLCKVLKRGKGNSCLVCFLSDGYMAVVSRNAIRKV
jgi:hypothetical protein